MKNKLLMDLKEALKSKDVIRKNTIQSIRNSILIEEKKKQIELSDSQIEELISKEVKKRNDELEFAIKANREDLIENANKELDILKSYLPKELSIEELNVIWEENKLKVQESGNNMGAAMKIIKPIVGTRFGGKELSEFIKNKLS